MFSFDFRNSEEYDTHFVLNLGVYFQVIWNRTSSITFHRVTDFFLIVTEEGKHF